MSGTSSFAVRSNLWLAGDVIGRRLGEVRARGQRARVRIVRRRTPGTLKAIRVVTTPMAISRAKDNPLLQDFPADRQAAAHATSGPTLVEDHRENVLYENSALP